MTISGDPPLSSYDFFFFLAIWPIWKRMPSYYTEVRYSSTMNLNQQKVSSESWIYHLNLKINRRSFNFETNKVLFHTIYGVILLPKLQVLVIMTLTLVLATVCVYRESKKYKKFEMWSQIIAVYIVCNQSSYGGYLYCLITYHF